MSSFANILSEVLIFISLYFEVFLFVSFFEKKEEEYSLDSIDENTLPTVTITVPVFNEETTVSKTIDTLLALDYPKNKLKIFVVDDGSKDNTWNNIQKYKGHPQIEIFQKENGGKYTVLNFGISRATSDIIGCLDADSFVPPDTLKKIAIYFRDAKTMAVIPSVKIHNPNSILRHIQSVEYDMGVFSKKVQDKLGAISITPGPFSFFRREVFEKIGPFKHAHNTEDMEIAMRMQKHHMKIKNAHDALVYTVGPNSIMKLHTQRVRWIYGNIRNLFDYREIILKKEYSHLGMFFMPMSIFALLTCTYYALRLIYEVLHFAFIKIIEISFAGIQFGQTNFHIDLFSFDTSAFTIMAIMLFVITILIIMYGRYLSENKIRFNWQIIYFLSLYPFISLFWILKSFFNIIFSRKTYWR